MPPMKAKASKAKGKSGAMKSNAKVDDGDMSPAALFASKLLKPRQTPRAKAVSPTKVAKAKATNILEEAKKRLQAVKQVEESEKNQSPAKSDDLAVLGARAPAKKVDVVKTPAPTMKRAPKAVDAKKQP